MAGSAVAPHRAERAALSDLFLERGADAPTLCEGWRAVDLAAHLLVRETNPLAGLGIVVGPLSGVTQKAMDRVRREETFQAIVGRVRSGPPAWWRPFDGLVNLVEYFVHHEDLRRGAGDLTPRPAEALADLEVALWRTLGRAARLLTRGVGRVPLALEASEFGRIQARRGEGESVVLHGRPGELVLYLSGRRAAADVSVTGPDAGRRAVEEADLGM